MKTNTEITEEGTEPETDESVKNEKKKSLSSSVSQIISLSKVMEELASKLFEEIDIEECPEESKQADQLNLLAEVILDMLSARKDDLLDAAQQYDGTEEDPDSGHIRYLWGVLKPEDKKTLMIHAIIHTGFREREHPHLWPGDHLYDLRRSLAKKYGIDLLYDFRKFIKDQYGVDSSPEVKEEA